MVPHGSLGTATLEHQPYSTYYKPMGDLPYISSEQGGWAYNTSWAYNANYQSVYKNFELKRGGLIIHNGLIIRTIRYGWKFDSFMQVTMFSLVHVSLSCPVCLAGGLATYIHADYVGAYIPQSVNFMGVADAG